MEVGVSWRLKVEVGMSWRLKVEVESGILTTTLYLDLPPPTSLPTANQPHWIWYNYDT